MFVSIIYKIIYLWEGMIWTIKRKYILRQMGAFGKGSSIGRNWTISTPSKVFIGEDTSIGDHCRLQCVNSEIHIGNHVMLAAEVAIHGGNHRFDIVGRYINSIGNDEHRPDDDGDVIIEDDCWIGGRATIMKGVTIGRGSVIGAGAIITCDIEPYSVVVGVNKVLRKRFTEEEILQHESMLRDYAGKTERY